MVSRRIGLKGLVVGLAIILPLAILTACSSTPNEDCTPLAKNGGSAVESIKVGLPAGGVPTATFTAPLSVTEPEVKVLKSGSGQKIQPGQSFTVELAMYNGKTGQSLGSSGFTGLNPVTATLDSTSEYSYINSVLQCARTGSRIVGVVPAKLIVDSKGADLTSGDSAMSLVVIAEISSVSMSKANGVPQAPVAGMPEVTLAASGAPSIKLPGGTAPTELKVAVLKKGDGATVTSSSTVIVHYTGWLWDGGTIFDSSWARGASIAFPVSGVVPGFAQALTGQTVGSQIIVIIPPELGYGAKGAGASVPPNATLVFVVDILGLEK